MKSLFAMLPERRRGGSRRVLCGQEKRVALVARNIVQKDVCAATVVAESLTILIFSNGAYLSTKVTKTATERCGGKVDNRFTRRCRHPKFGATFISQRPSGNSRKKQPFPKPHGAPRGSSIVFIHATKNAFRNFHVGQRRENRAPSALHLSTDFGGWAKASRSLRQRGSQKTFAAKIRFIAPQQQ